MLELKNINQFLNNREIIPFKNEGNFKIEEKITNKIKRQKTYQYKGSKTNFCLYIISCGVYRNPKDTTTIFQNLIRKYLTVNKILEIIFSHENSGKKIKTENIISKGPLSSSNMVLIVNEKINTNNFMNNICNLSGYEKN